MNKYYEEIANKDQKYFDNINKKLNKFSLIRFVIGMVGLILVVLTITSMNLTQDYRQDPKLNAPILDLKQTKYFTYNTERKIYNPNQLPTKILYTQSKGRYINTELYNIVKSNSQLGKSLQKQNKGLKDLTVLKLIRNKYGAWEYQVVSQLSYLSNKYVNQINQKISSEAIFYNVMRIIDIIYLVFMLIYCLIGLSSKSNLFFKAYNTQISRKSVYSYKKNQLYMYNDSRVLEGFLRNEKEVNPIEYMQSYKNYSNVLNNRVKIAYKQIYNTGFSGFITSIIVYALIIMIIFNVTEIIYLLTK